MAKVLQFPIPNDGMEQEVREEDSVEEPLLDSEPLKEILKDSDPSVPRSSIRVRSKVQEGIAVPVSGETMPRDSQVQGVNGVYCLRTGAGPQWAVDGDWLVQLQGCMPQIVRPEIIRLVYDVL